MYSEYEHITFTNFDRLEGVDIDIDMSMIHIPNENTEDYIFLDHYKDINIHILDELGVKEAVERYICIEYDYFIKDIRQSFKNREDIINQFRVDMPRCHIYINGFRVTEYMEFVDFIEYKRIGNVETVLMLCTQAFFGLPFQIIHQHLLKLENIYISDIGKNQHSYKININTRSNGIYFNVYKTFRIFELIDGMDVDRYMVYMKLELNLDTEEPVLMNITISNV